MRTLALCVAAVVMLAAPVAAQAGDRGKLTTGEARSAIRAYVNDQVDALEQFSGLSVASAHVSGRVERVGPRAMIVPAAFALGWDGGPSFVCLDRVHVTERGQSIRAHPSNFDCD